MYRVPLMNQRTPQRAIQQRESRSEYELMPTSAAVDRDDNSQHITKHPYKLKRPWLSFMTNLILFFATTSFIALTGLARSLDGAPESLIGSRVQNALLVSPTIFPICFAAICGKTTKSIALYYGQRGLKLRVLEHLSGAQSLYSSLERLFSLRNYGFYGIILTSIWFLSPLGGQALLRLLSARIANLQMVQNATYLSPDFLNNTDVLPGDSALSSLGLVTALYLSALLSTSNTRLSPRDSWGNPKIPTIRSVNEGDDRSDWNDVASQDIRYSNLLGIPLEPPRTNGSSHFIVPTRYLDVDCSSLEFTDTVTFHDNLQEPLFFAKIAGGGTYPNGTTIVQFQQFPPFQQGSPTSFLYMTNSSWNAFVTDYTQPITLFYGSQTDMQPGINFTGPPISLATCKAKPLMVHANISCIDQECSVTSLRTGVSNNSGLTFGLHELFYNGAFCGMGASSHPLLAGQTENFIQGVNSADYHGSASLWNMTLSDFEERFSQALNTYWYAAASLAFSSPLSTIDVQRAQLSSTTAWVSYNMGTHYECDKTWFGLALLALAIMEAMILICIVIDFLTNVPDVFGFVSSLTIGNRYCEAEGLVAGSDMDGIDRARRFGDHSFRLAKVDENGICTLAFVPVTTELASIGSEFQSSPRRR